MTRRLTILWLILLLLPLVSGAEGQEEDRPLWVTLLADQAVGSPDRVSWSSFAEVVERARPAVVAIHTMVQVRAEGAPDRIPSDPFPFNPWRLFPEVPRREREEGIGSGFVVREDGYVVTNHHVVANASALTVQLAGMGVALAARVVGSDPRSDLALLKVETHRPLPVLPLGSSDGLPVGAWVVAIGNPFGLTHVATKGIVSGKGRALGDLPQFRPGYFDFLQTDAAIDRGNSGGPLLNLKGEVVGINTAINSRARGIGFAIPVDMAKAVLPHLLRYGKVVRSYLGITIDEVTWEIAKSFGLDAVSGVLVTRVFPSTPAERGGMKPGDLILRFAGQLVSGRGDMSWRAATAGAGEPVKVEVWRSGKQVVLQISPASRPSEESSAKETTQEKKSLSRPRLGLLSVDLDAKTASLSKLPEGTRGVVVVGVEAEAAAHGVRVGDVITSVNDSDISNQEGFDRAVKRVKRGEMIRFYILRQSTALYIALPKRWD